MRPSLTKQGDDAVLVDRWRTPPPHPPAPTPPRSTGGVTVSAAGCRVGAAGPDGGRLQLWWRTRARGLHGEVVVMQEAGSTAEFPNVAGLHDFWL